MPVVKVEQCAILLNIQKNSPVRREQRSEESAWKQV